MIIATTLLATLISAMFVGSVFASITEMRRESDSEAPHKRYSIL